MRGRITIREETTVLDHGKGKRAVAKGGPAHPDDTLIGTLQLKVPGCWIAVMKRHRGRSNPHRPLTFDDVYPQ